MMLRLLVFAIPVALWLLLFPRNKASSAVWLPAVLLVWGAHPAALPGCCVLHPGPSARSPAPCGPSSLHGRVGVPDCFSSFLCSFCF